MFYYYYYCSCCCRLSKMDVGYFDRLSIDIRHLKVFFVEKADSLFVLLMDFGLYFIVNGFLLLVEFVSILVSIWMWGPSQFSDGFFLTYLMDSYNKYVVSKVHKGIALKGKSNTRLLMYSAIIKSIEFILSFMVQTLKNELNNCEEIGNFRAQ